MRQTVPGGHSRRKRAFGAGEGLPDFPAEVQGFDPLWLEVPVPNPHDTLFHFTFIHPFHAASWLCSLWPAEVATAVDWTSLAPADQRLPGLRLRPHFADLVFAANAAPSELGTVLLLVEHKSHVDPGLEWQLLRYAVLLHRAHQQQHGRRPAVLAAVLQHGAEASAATAAAATSPFAPYQPRLLYVVDDLRRDVDRALAGRSLTPLAELTLRALATLPSLAPADVPVFFERWQQLLVTVDRADGAPEAPPLGSDATDALGFYALAVTDVDPATLAATFTRLLHRPEDTIMSTLERTYQKGRLEGHQQGHREGQARGKAESLLRLLQRRFGPLPADLTQRVTAADNDELDRWTDRVLDVHTLAELFTG